MSNYYLRDHNLPLKAKGLLSYTLSLPEDQDYSLNGLCAICNESEKSIKSILKELKDNGYLMIEKVSVEKGHLNTIILSMIIHIIQKNQRKIPRLKIDLWITTGGK